MSQQIFAINPQTLADADSDAQERLSEEEVRAVIALWTERQGDARPTVADLAEGLDASVEEVQALLQEVRDRRVQRQYAISQEQERLAQELTQLAQERTRLAGAERRLVYLHEYRAYVYDQRVQAQQPRPVYVPQPRAAKSRRQVRPAAPPTLADALVVPVAFALSVGGALALLTSLWH